jgi:hypothetical protein
MKNMKKEEKMKVWVLAISTSEGCARPSVFDSKEKAIDQMAGEYYAEVETQDEDKQIEASDINREEGWAYIQYRDYHVDFAIYGEEVK